MNRREFVGHQVASLAMSKPDAEALWTAEVRNPARARRGTGDNLRLAVQDIPKTRVSSGVAYSRSLCREAPLDLASSSSASQLDQVATALNPAALPAIGSDTFAVVDRSGLAYAAAVASVGQSDPLGQLAVAASQVGTTALTDVMVDPPQLAAIMEGSPPRDSRRSLKAAPSDPAAPKPASRAAELQAARTAPGLFGSGCQFWRFFGQEPPSTAIVQNSAGPSD